MTVADDPRVDTHTGNGSSTNFAYGYRIFADADLTVTVDGVIQTLTTDYTVNGAGDAGGGSIDFVTAPINLSVVTISGELTYDRAIDYIDNGPFPAETFDNDHDRAIMLIQQLRRDVKRAIKVPIEETTDQEVSTIPANRANKILAFDSAGLPVASSITDVSSILTTVDTSLVLSSEVLSVAIPNRQAAAGGTVDAITATFVPTIPALVNHIEVVVEAGGANATATPTFAPDGLTAKTIVKENDVALVAGDIPGANYRMHLVFDATLDKWVLLNPVNPSTLLMAGPIVLPAGSEAAPAIGWINSGLYESTGDQISLTLNGSRRWIWSVNSFEGDDANGPAMFNEAASATNPTLIPDKVYGTSGLGSAGANLPSLIVSGVEIARVVASGLTLQVAAASPPAVNTLSKENIVKGWIHFNAVTPAIDSDFNVDTIVDNGVGDFTINWDRDFADVNYVATGSHNNTASNVSGLSVTNYAVGSVDVLCLAGAAATDPTDVSVIAIGNQ